MGSSRTVLAKAAIPAHPPPEQSQLEQDPRWPVVQRVIGSPLFSRSARLSQFLRYVCERTILGLQDEINEQHVGVHVFDRAPAYNPSEDNIVRTHARLLRKKLEEYYSAEGKEEPIRIVIPKGAYVPEFHDNGLHTELVEAVAKPSPQRLRWVAVAGLVVAAVAVTGLVYRRQTANEPQEMARRFWGQLFSAARPTVIVPSDTALVLYQVYTGRTIGLNEYVARAFWQQFDTPKHLDRESIQNLSRLPYTNNVDLNFSWSLSRNPLIDSKTAVIRPSRDLRMADLKGVNIVLVGARRANPWVELFDRENTFAGVFDAELRDHVLNRDPRGTERKVYRDQSVNGVNHAFAIVAFKRGLTGQENVLLLSGTTTAGTEGAADFVLNERSLGGFLQKIAPGKAIPHFEVVLDVENVVGSSPRAAVVAYRVSD